MQQMIELKKWLRSLVCAFVAGTAALGAVALIATPMPAYAGDDDDDDRDDDRDDHGKHHGSRDFRIEVLSGRRDMVAGGDALVRVTIRKSKVAVRDVRVTLNGANITANLVADATARTLSGLVTGMRVGDNDLEAGVARNKRRGHNGDSRAHLRIVNHPIQGPIFSGPHQQPYACATHQFSLVPAQGPQTAVLGTLTAPPNPIDDPNCHVPTRVDYLYRTNATPSLLAVWPAGATAYPANMARTPAGKPYIVRMETGTVNRAIYQITMLHDPLTDAAPNWQRQSANWNKRLIYTFGGGCFGGWYRQGASTGGVLDDFMLSNGYALASSSLNVFGNNCSDLTAAESMMMVKERFIEKYGQPAHTQGWGCSGGSYAQHQIADNYPGLLDGIIPGCSFPEVGFGTISFITDAWLLDTYFNKTTLTWTPAQKVKVTGFNRYETVTSVLPAARRIDPVTRPAPQLGTSCAAVPAAQRYDPVNKPTGVRCTVFDHTVNVYGRDPATGFARRPLDNVGIQYGLKMLNNGTITPEQFVDLNEKIGGFDIDANIVAKRTVADLEATRAAYRTGRLTNGGGGLADIPIIDYRGYIDDLPSADIHVRYHSFSMRERLEKANGHAKNHVMVVEDGYGLYSNASPLLQRMILTMDRWITAIKADKGDGRKIDKIVRNRPADLKEGCNPRGVVTSPTAFIAEEQVREQERATTCNTLYSTNSFPREVAGAGIAADIIKCRRKELKQSDYSATFTPAQWARLQATFPDGVCDWNRRGYEQRDLKDTWIVFDAN
jgi:Tannase-like family of unknown function (DUF6351)